MSLAATRYVFMIKAGIRQDMSHNDIGPYDTDALSHLHKLPEVLLDFIAY